MDRMQDLVEYENYLKEVAFFANQGGTDASENDGDQVPIYMLGNGNNGLLSINHEQDLIREAYSSATYASIRDLPNNIRPGEVVLARQLKLLERQKQAIVSEDLLRIRRNAIKNNGLFHQFEYIPSRYTLAKEMEAQERLESKAKSLEMGRGREFVCTSSGSKMKYEDGFGDTEYRYPYQSDPYDSMERVNAEEKALEREKILHGPFMPAGRSARHELQMSTRQRLPEMKKVIEKILEQDWEDCKFEVSITQDEQIAIRFELLHLDGQLVGLRAYMNILESANRDILRFNLKRSGDQWNKQPGDGWIYFILRPPFVKQKSVGPMKSSLVEESDEQESKY